MLHVAIAQKRKSKVCMQTQMETLTLPEQIGLGATGHNFILCIKGRWAMWENSDHS